MVSKCKHNCILHDYGAPEHLKLHKGMPRMRSTVRCKSSALLFIPDKLSRIRILVFPLYRNKLTSHQQGSRARCIHTLNQISIRQRNNCELQVRNPTLPLIRRV